MADEADLAQERIERETQAQERRQLAEIEAIEARLAACDPQRQELCEDCDEAIEPARILALAPRRTSRCAECAQRFEYKNKRPSWT